MNSNVNKEEIESNKKKYVFFSDPDIIIRRAETSAAASQALQNLHILQQQQQRIEPKVSQIEAELTGNVQSKSDLKGLETLLSYHPVQPYPFTFITAVKRKLALNMHAEACKRAYEPETLDNTQADVGASKTSTDFKGSINQMAQKMDFIKPLKVPDLKISPKTLDYSQRDNFPGKEISQPSGSLSSKKFDTLVLDDVLVSNKSSKIGEKAYRKLDFSSLEGSPVKNCDAVEQLKVPDSSISLSKKKEHARDSSREKENRSKRIKKDDSGLSRNEDLMKETPRRSRTSRHLSRRDVEEVTESIFGMFKSENFLSHAPRESDFTMKKPKSKNFLTSTAKKNEDWRRRSTSVQSARSTQMGSSDSKARDYDDDTNSDRNTKLHDRITIRDNYKPKPSDVVESSHKNATQNLHSTKQHDDRVYKNTEASGSQQEYFFKLLPQGQTKQQFETYSKIQTKKLHEKQKPATSQSESNISHSTSDISEDMKDTTGSNVSLKDANDRSKMDTTGRTDDSMRIGMAAGQQFDDEDHREVEQSGRHPQTSSQTEKYHSNVDESGKVANSSGQNAETVSNPQELSTNEIETFGSSKQSNDDYKSSQSKSFSIILDPTRISFRDESSEEQSEFRDLVTPHISLVPRSKRKKNLVVEQENETDVKSPKHKPSNIQSKDAGIQLLHPTALHMQFQAELHLLDTFNESLKQVTDVENCLYSVKYDQEQEFLHKQREQEMKKQLILMQSNKDTVDNERHQMHQSRNMSENANKNDFTQGTGSSCGRGNKKEDEIALIEKAQKCVDNQISECLPEFDRMKQLQSVKEDIDSALRKNRLAVRVTEVQTQTANDIATQTEIPRSRRRHNPQARQISGITYHRGTPDIDGIPQLSLESLEQFEEFNRIENVSLPSRMHTMSEISLHETTSSIRTETGTEISISTRDVTCSFNKYLDSELAQLIKDEKQRYDEIEMLFKSREKTLNDRTKKLVKLEEQKRALRDMGQDSRISSVKKKQRALLLKLQQEKDEMTRLKELHKKASQERKLMLQKQRNMLNPQMSTKNILTKLKRSADSQSPRRLSGPMKGYDIRSPSSMSSLVDSDKSQLDRSHIETKSQTSDTRLHKSDAKTTRTDFIPAIQEGLKSSKTDNYDNMTEVSDISPIDLNKSAISQAFDQKIQKAVNASHKPDTKSRYEAKSCKYREKMPKPDSSFYKSHNFDVDSNSTSRKSMKLDSLTGSEKCKSKDTAKLTPSDLDKSISENIKSESDTLVDELSKRSKSSQAEALGDYSKSKKDKDSFVQKNNFDVERPNTDSESIAEEISLKKSKSLQVTDDTFEVSSKSLKKSQASNVIGKDSMSRKSSSSLKLKSTSKRKGSRSAKSKSSADILSDNILRSKSSSQISDEILKHHGKRSKIDKNDVLSEDNCENALLEDLDANESQSSLQALVKHSKAVKEKNYALMRNIANDNEVKENLPRKNLDNLRNVSRREEANLPNVGNMSTRSQVSTLTISHHSSGESEKSYSRSVVIRAQDHHFRTSKKLEQILTAREAALTSRRNCVEEWIAWHSRLRAEESRVARMEEAAFKLVNATSNALSYHDTTVSSDTSDVESRIEVLAEKLAERRTEMARLKREAKRQAKQRLKALETNLLNQIKKYDSTIHEMRKKLESKRGTMHDTSSEKLAIESKSLTDFKIPDIPIKRIKEIYKNSDLLKSRSESELKTLISGKDQRGSYNSSSDHTARTASDHKSPKSFGVEPIGSTIVTDLEKKIATQSIQSIFEDGNTVPETEPDVVSENIEFQSESECSEANDYPSSAKMLYDKIKQSQPKAIRVRKSISQQDRDGISEDSQVEISEKELPSESLYTAFGEQFSKENEDSIRASVSKSTISEIRSEIGDHDAVESESVSKNIISAQRTSDNRDTIDELIVECEISRGRKSDEIEDKSSLVTDSRDYSARSEDTASKSGENGQKSPRNIADVETSDVAYSVDEEISEESRIKSRSSSKKLSFLELGNKNLNDDISTLENDLKVLSEMMSQFSRKSEGKSKTEILSDIAKESPEIVDHDSERETSRDVSDFDYPRSDRNDPANDFESTPLQHSLSKSNIIDEAKTPTTGNPNATYVVDHVDQSRDQLEKDLSAQVTEIMSKIMPEHETRKSMPSEEIDIKARSRKILNEIEKSIISEHSKSPESASSVTDGLSSHHSSPNRNEKIIDTLDSSKNDSVSASRTISEAIEVAETEPDVEDTENLETESLPERKKTAEEVSKAEEFGSDEVEGRDKFPEDNRISRDESSHRSNSAAFPIEDAQDPSTDVPEPSKDHERMEKVETTPRVSPDPTSFGKSDATFEFVRDPEYEDISEESMEVSEIMERSESQRSDRFSQKSTRLPDKYEVRQKSEDVLRILDEITQKSSKSLRTNESDQLEASVDPRCKIDELLDRSRKLSENFEQLIKTPKQATQELEIRTTGATIREEPRNDRDEVTSKNDKKDVVERARLEDEDSLMKRGSDVETIEPFTGHSNESLSKRKIEEKTDSTIFDAKESATLSPELEARLEVVETVLVHATDENSTESIDEELQEDESRKSDHSSTKADKDSKTIENDSRIDVIASASISRLSKTKDDEETSKQEEIESGLSKSEKISCGDDDDTLSSGSGGDSGTLSQKLDKLRENREMEIVPVADSGTPVNIPIEEKDLSRIVPPVERSPFAGTVDLAKTDATESTVDLAVDLESLPPKSEDSSQKTSETEQSDELSRKSEDVLQKYDVDLPSESSEDVDTPRSVSEIEMDSPRDPNDSRLDIEVLDDELLDNENNYSRDNAESTTEFHASPQIVSTSEKDIEAMIDKLKVSVEQPGLDVAELEAKLLRIQQLQIELEIKKLEAEQVSYYVREIPNKPPPPYTPPSGGRLPVSQTSPSPAPAVVPTNVDDLTSFTEKATQLIYEAKQSGVDIVNLEPPMEICQLSKDNNETAKKDRRIYNTFLFDLCKETIAEVYQSEYEKPGPSWLKPNAKTKPTVKIPKTVEVLNDYVSKEVATLFGFKTKLQRENLVMRWSRKRRDRVDELLAREAQAEEDEWTKFHHDELAVKNELTNMILDSLILDAAKAVKIAYIKKRKMIS